MTAEGLGWQLRAALPPMRLHSVSLCDADGDVLWLSEGVLGPDEHGFVQEAIALLSGDAQLVGTERDLEDGRGAVFLPVRAPQGAIVGIAMILIDGKSVSRGLAVRLVTPQVRTVLMRIAMLLKQATPPARTEPPPRSETPARNETPTRGETPRSDTAARAAVPVRGQPPRPASIPTLAPAVDSGEIGLAPDETQPVLETLQVEATAAQIDTILTLELAEDAPPPSNPPPPPPRRGAPERSAKNSPRDELTLLPDDAPAGKSATPPPPPKKANGAATSAPLPASRAAKPDARPATAPERAPAHTDGAAAPAPRASTSAAKAAGSVIGEKRAPEPSQDLALSVQQLLKLRSGGRTRRYEVLLRSRHDTDRNEMPHTLVQAAAREIGEGALDEFVVSELLTFLGSNRGVWESEPSSFTVNLSAGAITDEGFAQVVEDLLHRTQVAPECLGFEIPQSCCVHEPLHVERFANACDKLGCFIVLDDYTLDPRAVPLLRSRTLKLIKIDPKLTTAAMKDRVSQALVVAIAQAAKVLGVHSVAKRVESQQTRQWLAAIGIDFAQGFALEGPHSLESLAPQGGRG